MSTPGDKILQSYLSGESALSARYRAHAGEEPPAHLDAAIAAAARREVGARPALVGSTRLRKWYVPLSAAAVVVLASLLVLRVGQAPQVQPGAGEAQVAEQVLGPVPTAPAGGEAPAVSSTHAEAPSVVAAGPAAPANEPLAQASGTVASDAAAKAKTARIEQRAAAKKPDPVLERDARGADAQSAAGAAGALQEEPALPAEVAEPPLASTELSAQATPPAPAPEDALERSRQASQANAAPEETQHAPMKQAAVAPAPGARSDAEQSAAVADAVGEMRTEQAGVLAKRESAAVAPSAPARAGRQQEVTAFEHDPQRWLARLLELERRGERDVLARELRAFKRRYAQHALPPSLEQRWQAIQREDSQSSN